MTWHGYLGLINTGLAKGERDTLKALVKQLGPSQDRDPSRINHSRERLDGAGILIVAAFEEGEIDEDGFKARLETITGIGAGEWVTEESKASFGNYSSNLTTYSARGTDYITVIHFGGSSGTWEEGKDEANNYIIANAGAWEGIRVR